MHLILYSPIACTDIRFNGWVNNNGRVTHIIDSAFGIDYQHPVHVNLSRIKILIATINLNISSDLCTPSMSCRAHASKFNGINDDGRRKADSAKFIMEKMDSNTRLLIWGHSTNYCIFIYSFSQPKVYQYHSPYSEKPKRNHRYCVLQATLFQRKYVISLTSAGLISAFNGIGID